MKNWVPARFSVIAVVLWSVLSIPKFACADTLTYAIDSNPVDSATFGTGTVLVDEGGSTASLPLLEVTYSAAEAPALAGLFGTVGTYYEKILLDEYSAGTHLLQYTFTDAYLADYTVSTDSAGVTTYDAKIGYGDATYTYGISGGGTGVPEPSSLILLSAGALGLLRVQRRKFPR